jgi:glucose-1-phosphate cytidylyltransferase
MKAVIFAGGLGTRISEESDLRPKPMVEIGGRPILWHIMKMYASHGVKDFVICLGYKGYMIKEYFFNYYRHTADFSINLGTGDYEVLGSDSEDWNVTFIDTGLETQTGGRLKRVQKYVGNETFCLTYGDGLSDLDISKEIEFHKSHDRAATVAAVQPPGRFATLGFDDDGHVDSFREKMADEVGWINGGFFVLEPSVFDLIQEGDSTIWERGPLETLASTGQLAAFKHDGFWKPMDNLREKRELEALWNTGKAPWLN